MSEKTRTVLDVEGRELEKSTSSWRFTNNDVVEVSEIPEGLQIEQEFSFLDGSITRQVKLLVDWDLDFEDTMYLAQHALKTLRSQRFCKENAEEIIKLAKKSDVVKASMFTPKNERKAKDPVKDFEQAARKLGITQDQIDRLLNRR